MSTPEVGLGPVPVSGGRLTETRPTMAELRGRRDALRGLIEAGDPAGVERRHDRGKRTARERLALLLDEGSFVELGVFRRRRREGSGTPEYRAHTDGVGAGSGTIGGRRVFVYAQDFTILGDPQGVFRGSFRARDHQVVSRCADFARTAEPGPTFAPRLARDRWEAARVPNLSGQYTW